MTNQRPADELTNETNQTMTQNQETQRSEESSEVITLRPHPNELASAVNGDHVVVFSWDSEQYEVSGSTEHDEEISPEWETIELTEEQAGAVLEGATVFMSREDEHDAEYTIEVRGGERHPKGTPVHTRGGEDGVQ